MTVTAALRSGLAVSIQRFGRWYARRNAPPRTDLHRPLDRALRAGARLYARCELPRCVQLLQALMVNRQDLWADAAPRECRGCWHGYRLRLDLSDFYQRWSYFLSRYHEVPIQLLLRRTLRPRDTFIDGGANNGLVTLVGAWLVGPRGRVFSFEPNPRVHEQLQWHITANGLAHVTPLRQGLSDTAEELRLQVPGADNLGAGTFSPIPARYRGVIADACTASTIRGDNLPQLPGTGSLVIKLDIEGFETRALRGLDRTIVARRPLIITEINREMLIAAGSSPYELFQLMHARGYHGFGFDTARAVIRQRRLVLWHVPGTGPRLPRDIAWIHPNSQAAARLRAFIADPPPPGAPGARS